MKLHMSVNLHMFCHNSCSLLTGVIFFFFVKFVDGFSSFFYFSFSLYFWTWGGNVNWDLVHDNLVDIKKIGELNYTKLIIKNFDFLAQQNLKLTSDESYTFDHMINNFKGDTWWNLRDYKIKYYKIK